MAVRLERQDEIATIVLDRAEARNAVNAVTARELSDAFREFEADAALKVAVLWGANGVFCAGADLKGTATGQPLRRSPYGDGPMGPSRMVFSKPTIAAVEGYAVAGGWTQIRSKLLWPYSAAPDEAVASLGAIARRDLPELFQ